MYKLLVTGLLLGFAAQLFAAPSGEELYVRYCNACHQLNGSGGIGLPLTREKLDDVDDTYLFETIRRGRPGRVMPAFTQMSDAQINAIVKHLRKRSNTQSMDFSKSAPLQGDATHGKQLFTTHCIACHGEDGTGEGQGTGVTLSRKRSFLVMPPAISNRGFQASANDHMIKQIIKVGRPESGMPAFAQKGLKEQDINDLVTYVRALGKQQAQKTMPTEEKSLSNVYESPYDFETTVKNIKTALVGANFRTFPDRFLEQGALDEFSVNKRQIGIRFCNFKELYGMLNIEPRLGVVLPCRITILEREDKTVLLVVPNLNVVSRWFNNDELSGLWEVMQETFEEIIEEATI